MRRSIECRCECGLEDFRVRLDREEQVGLVSCCHGHHSLLLDSRDYWAEVTQDCRPKAIKCRCGANTFGVQLDYEFRNDGEVRSVDVMLICRACRREPPYTTFDIDYTPTESLLEKPLDRIEEPWLRALRIEITAYWRPTDAQRFAEYLTGTLSARVLRREPDLKECAIVREDFRSEPVSDLYFSPVVLSKLPSVRDPEKFAPLLKLSSPFRIAIPGGLALLYYIEYAEEIPSGAQFEKQPPTFRSFSKNAADWLKAHYSSTRGPHTADNPEEYARVASIIPRNRRD